MDNLEIPGTTKIQTQLLIYREALRLAVESGRMVDRSLLPQDDAHTTRVTLSIAESALDVLSRVCSRLGLDDIIEELDADGQPRN